MKKLSNLELDDRLIFEKGKQRQFMEEVKNSLNIYWPEIAKICGMNEQTVRWDIRHEVHSISYKVFHDLCLAANINPKIYLRHVKEIRNKNWGRSKGGKLIIAKNRAKFKIHISKPQRNEELSEFIGIMLGDGSISKTNYCIEVILHRIHDSPYQDYVHSLVYRLFDIEPRILERKNSKVTVLRVNSKQLFDFLVKINLPIGESSKKIPTWVLKEKKFLRECLRGLFDTDGSIFLSKKHVIINFSNRSPKLIKEFRNGLEKFDIKYHSYWNSVNITSLKGIEKFFKEIGSSNLKHIIKFVEYINSRRSIRSDDLESLFQKYSSIKIPFRGAVW